MSPKRKIYHIVIRYDLHKNYWEVISGAVSHVKDDLWHVIINRILAGIGG